MKSAVLIILLFACACTKNHQVTNRAPACQSDFDCEFNDECVFTDVSSEARICLRDYDRREAEKTLLDGDRTLEKAKKLQALSKEKVSKWREANEGK